MTKISDERLAEMLERVSPPSDGWHAGLPTMDVHAALTELQQLRAHNSDSAEPVNTASAIISQGRRICAAEITYAKRRETDDLAARDEPDRLYADMQAMFDLPDYDAALAVVARRRKALASPPAKEVDTNLINEVIDFLGGMDGAVELRGRLIALTNRTTDDEVGNE